MKRPYISSSERHISKQEPNIKLIKDTLIGYRFIKNIEYLRKDIYKLLHLKAILDFLSVLLNKNNT